MLWSFSDARERVFSAEDATRANNARRLLGSDRPTLWSSTTSYFHHTTLGGRPASSRRSGPLLQ